jgi:uncharacterized protein (DUF1778 family)
MPVKNPKRSYITLAVTREQAKLVQRAAELENRSVMNWCWNVVSEKLEQLQSGGVLK